MRCAGAWGWEGYFEQLRVQLLQHARHVKRVVAQLPAVVHFQPLELQINSNQNRKQSGAGAVLIARGSECVCHLRPHAWLVIRELSRALP